MNVAIDGVDVWKPYLWRGYDYAGTPEPNPNSKRRQRRKQAEKGHVKGENCIGGGPKWSNINAPTAAQNSEPATSAETVDGFGVGESLGYTIQVLDGEF